MNDVCPSCKATSVVGIQVNGVYDGVLFWECGVCGYCWHRWPEGSPYRKRAAKYMEENRD